MPRGTATTSGRPASRVRAAIVLLVVLFAAVPVAPQSDLDRIKSDITRMRKRLDDVRQKAQTAEREVEEADLQLAIQTRELELAIDAEAQLAAEQSATERRIAELGPAIERQKAELRNRLVALYRMGELSYLRMLLALDQEENPVDAISMLSYLVSRDSRAVSRFQAAQAELTRNRQQLGDRRELLRRTRLDIEERRRSVASAVAQKQSVLVKLRIEEKGTSTQLAALEEKARRLQRLVDSFRRQEGGIAPELDVRSVQGALAWPVKGKVTERFGKQRNPKFATVTTNNGLKIESAPGTEVRAVFQGTVLYSQWFKGYGNLIILDHGNRVFSLYGNVKSPIVTVGSRVTTGQPIAGVGESEDQGGHLYFEIRRDGQPEDPQKWLR